MGSLLLTAPVSARSSPRITAPNRRALRSASATLAQNSRKSCRSPSCSPYSTSTTRKPKRSRALSKFFRSPKNLILNSVHRDAAQKLRKKIRRLLRHHFICRRNLHNFFHVARIQEERNLRSA